MENQKCARVGCVQDADVPTVQVLCADVLRGEVTQELSEFRDLLDVVLHFEFFGGRRGQLGFAMGTDLGGDAEGVASGGVRDNIEGVWCGRGEAALDAYCRKGGELLWRIVG